MYNYLKSDASVEAYLTLFYSGKDRSNKRKVYKKLEKFPLVDIHFLIRKLKMSHQTVSSCISRLMDIGIVEISGANITIGASGPVYTSRFFIQKDMELIKRNVKARRKLKLTRAIRIILQFDDILPDNIIKELNQHKIISQ